MTWPPSTALVVLLVVALLALFLWLTSTARRLDRLHHSLDLARDSLQSQLLHRSGTALELAASGVLDPARSLLLLDAAHNARATPEDEAELAESQLSQTLRAVLADDEELTALRADPHVGPLLDELGDTCLKVELARRFHNDLVTSTRSLRSRRRSRWFRLTGGAAEPATLDLDGEPPPGLVR